MKRLLALGLPGVLVAAAGSWAGCSSGDSNTDSGGAAITGATSFSACNVVSVKDGHSLSADELGKLGDPIANLVLKGQDCPLTLTQIQAKLKKTDPCPAPGSKVIEAGPTSRFVTDRSQLLEKPDTYRAVLTRACQKRSDEQLLISVFGISTQTDAAGKVTSVSVPDDSVELIGEKMLPVAPNGATSGVFNYYAREQNQWKFFGSSTDFLSQGYDCNRDGACIPKAATKQRCASCHVGGGLNMKELESPWTNWEGGGNSFGHGQGLAGPGVFGTPGVADIVAKRPDLFGIANTGIEMEGTVETGNSRWVPARVAFLQTLGLKEVLRPLFCTTDMNLLAAGVNRTPVDGKPVSESPNGLSSELFADRIWSRGLDAGREITLQEYTDAIKANGQRIIDGRTGRTLVGSDGQPVPDTVQGLMIPIRSGQDANYVDELQRQRVVDIDLVKDVLNVDFTRPVYSSTRCGILDQLSFAPELPPGQMTFTAVKKRLSDALAAVPNPSPAIATLSANLQDLSDAGKHDLEAATFLKACDERSKSDRAGYIKDYLAFASHLRLAVKRARNPVNGGIIEFAETLPVDDLPETTGAFDPKTCKLQ